jgi:hypothetical protein
MPAEFRFGAVGAVPVNLTHQPAGSHYDHERQRV